MSECATNVSTEFPEVTEQEAELLLLHAKNLAEERAKKNGGNMPKAVDEANAILSQRDKLEAAAAKRAAYNNMVAEDNYLEYAQRFPTFGEGLMAFIEGSNYAIKGARKSVEGQIRALDRQYFGRVLQEIKDAGVFREFRRNELSKEIYIESAELAEDGNPGSSGSPAAKKIAAIIDNIQQEMTARLNAAGAYIGNIPGYLARQTHDMFKIRAAGATKEEAYAVWKNHVLPRLDVERTFKGADPELFMRNVFDSLYSGVHGVMGQEGLGVTTNNALYKKLSQERIIHFKDAMSAWEYNETFGTKDVKQQVMTDITNKARAIAILENMGGSPETTLLNTVRRLKELARSRPDAAKQIDSISDSKIMSAYRQLTGVNDIPDNPNLARVSANVRAVTQMSMMGSVLLTNMFSDRAFMHTELAYQGIKALDIFAKQLTSFAKKTPDQRKTLNMMGVLSDGIVGNALSRYSATGPVSGMIDKAQKLFFDINFHNYWSDVTKSATAEMMVSHLGQHSDTPFTKLPEELSRILSMYDIGPAEWNVLRKSAYEHPSNWGKIVASDGLATLPDDTIKAYLVEVGKPTTAKNINRARRDLDTALRTFIQDRTEFAVPSGNGQVRRILTADTKAGTYMGEAIRLAGVFKSFPVAVATRVIQREIYGRGSMSAKQWLLNDHAGKFYLAQLIAMTTVAGYLGMVIKDALGGKAPRPLLKPDGSINWNTLNESAVRGGGLGIMGEMIMAEHDKSYRTVLKTVAGPILSQADVLAEMKTKAVSGEPIQAQLYKTVVDNTPLLNLFYARPVLNYYVLWNLQEMMNPGSLRRTEKFIEHDRGQEYFFKPSEQVK